MPVNGIGEGKRVDSYSAERLRLRAARLRPCLPGARNIINRASVTNLRQLFAVLDAIRGQQGQKPFHRLFIRGLDVERSDISQAEIANPLHASELRHIVEEVLHCRLAYRTSNGDLVIGEVNEINNGIESGELLYAKQPPEKPAAPPQISTAEAPVVVPTITPKMLGAAERALVPIEVDMGSLAKSHAKLRVETVIDIACLVARGDYDNAAALVFYRRDASEAWEIIEAVSKLETVQDKDTGETIRLALEVELLEGRTIYARTFLASVLLGHYLPRESARLLSELVGRKLVTTPEAADIFAYQEAESVSTCARVFSHMVLQANASLVNQIFRGGYSRDNIRPAFENMLAGLHETYRTGVYSPDEYKGTGTIFRRNQQVVRALAFVKRAAGSKKIEAAASTDTTTSTALVVYEGSIFDRPELFDETSPDVHLRSLVRNLLANGETRLAAQMAFGDGPVYEQMYLNMRHNFEPQENGLMLAALDRQELCRRLVDFHQNRPRDYDRAFEVSETLVSAFCYFGGGQSEVSVAKLIEDMIIQGEAQPEKRWAAYWILREGLSYFRFGDPALTQEEVDEQTGRVQTNYYAVANRLAEKHQADGWRDAADFLRHGGFLETDTPSEDRNEQLRFYWSILNDETRPERDRIFTARMLGALGAVEYFDDLRKIIAAELKAKIHNELSMRLVRTYIDICDGLDISQVDHQRHIQRAAKFLKGAMEILADLFGSDIEASNRILYETKGVDAEIRTFKRAWWGRYLEINLLFQSTIVLAQGGFSALSEIASILAQTRLFDQAGLFDRVLTEARKISKNCDKASALGRIASTMAQAKMPMERVAKVFAEALATARESNLGDKTWTLSDFASASGKDGSYKQALAEIREARLRDKVSALLNIASAMAQAKMPKERIEEMFEEVLAEYRNIPCFSEIPYKASALGQIVSAMAQARLFDQALARIREFSDITDPWHSKASALRDIASAMAQAGLFDQALAAAREISEISDKASALGQIGSAMAQAKISMERAVELLQEVFAEAMKISDIRFKVSKLNDIALAMAQARIRKERVAEVFGKTLGEARKISNIELKANDLEEIASTMAQTNISMERITEIFGDASKVFIETFEAVRENSEISQKALALQYIASAMAQAGLFDQALAAAREISETSYKASALRNIASAMAQAGLFDQALATAQEISEIRDKASALRNIASAMAQANIPTERVVESLRAALTEAKKVWLDRNILLSSISTALTQAGDVSRALRIKYSAHDLSDLVVAIYKYTNPQTEGLSPIQTNQAWLHTRIFAIFGMTLEVKLHKQEKKLLPAAPIST